MPTPVASHQPASGPDEALLAELRAAEAQDAAAVARAKGADATQTANVKAEDPAKWLPAQARSVLGNEANPSISILLDVGAAAFSNLDHYRQGGHSPSENGPTIQGVELAAFASVDPFFRIDMAFGVWDVEIEEIFVTTTALPLNLQLRAGQFNANVGRHNPLHLHRWHFANQPLPNEYVFGAEGLAAPGIELSFLFPLPWYVELVGALQMGDRGSFRTPLDSGAIGFGDFIYPLRLVQFFDVTDDTAIQLGVNAVIAPSQKAPELGHRAWAYGLDWMLKWRPIGWGETGYTYVAWTNEAWTRLMEVVEDRWDDLGGYSELVFGIDKEWEAAMRMELWKRLRGDVSSPEIDRPSYGADTVRPSVSVTYMPSHFSKVRTQYTFERLGGFDSNHIGLLQLEVSAGAHGAHQH